ncbi:hypothetical protein [Corynebacterium uterequi]|uniref:hypothetical protein n=1 Tax=Corynebacterium uterequi TaxID=1072256 RepID=UPI00118752C1|nr:hypothetical protein [Corynebacterium uterequi]
MSTEFDAFLQEFRRRTGERLLEFEKVLAVAQADVEQHTERALSELAAQPAGRERRPGNRPRGRGRSILRSERH